MKPLFKWLLVALSKLSDYAIIEVLHAAFRLRPRLHSVFAHAMLTYDTEAVGLTMDLKAPAAPILFKAGDLVQFDPLPRRRIDHLAGVRRVVSISQLGILYLKNGEEEIPATPIECSKTRVQQ